MTALAALSALVALACVIASAARLAWAVSPTSLDPVVLALALTDADAAETAFKIRDAIEGSDDMAWERGVFGSLSDPTIEASEARLGEQLTEFDGAVRRWSRVPRVCASLSTSAGFLFASLAMTRALADTAPGASDTTAVLVSALDALTLGIAGTSFCAAVHVRSCRVSRERIDGATRLISRLAAIARALDSTRAPADRQG